MGCFGENSDDMEPGDVFHDLEAGLDEHDRSVRKAPQHSSGKRTILYSVIAAVGMLVVALIFYWVYTRQLPSSSRHTDLVQELRIALVAKNDELCQMQKADAGRIKGLEDANQELETALADAKSAPEATSQVASLTAADTAQADRIQKLELKVSAKESARLVLAGQLTDKNAELAQVQKADAGRIKGLEDANQELETALAAAVLRAKEADKKLTAAKNADDERVAALTDAAEDHVTRVQELEAARDTAVLRAEKFEAAANKLKAAAPVGTKDLEAAKQELVAKLTAAEEAHATRVKLEAERDLENLKKRAEVLVAKLESVYYPGDKEAEYYSELHNKATPLA
eukprot:905319_1